MFNKPTTMAVLLTSIFVTACASNNIKQPEKNSDKQKSEVVLSDFPVESDTEVTSKPDVAQLHEDTKSVSKSPKIKIVNFNFDKIELSEENKILLKQHAEFLKSHPGYVLSVNGHSDYRGPELYNEKLSLRRANSVATLLMSFGAPESQLIINSFGASQPIEDYDNWFQNRRVELEYSELYMVSK